MRAKRINPVWSLLLLLLLGACSSPEEEARVSQNWLTLAQQSEGFLQKAKLNIGDHQAWKIMPDSSDVADPGLYSGSAGVVLFYLDLFQATQDSSYLQEAVFGADYLQSTLKDSIYPNESLGLYTGVAGIGYTLATVYQVTGREKYRKAVDQTIKIITQSAAATANGIHWGAITDIVYGGAGIGLYFQHVAQVLNHSKADSLAILTANGLLDQAIQSNAGWRWKFMPDYDAYLDNFSHGTAGTAYFLAKMYAQTNDHRYLEAAIKGANLLDSLTNEKGYVPHHLPGGEELFYLNWCHGPAGTSRLYYLLYDLTEEEKWKQKILQPADSLMQEGIDQAEKPGYWNNVGKCCGAASVAEYYLWLYNFTGSRKYLEFAKIMTQQILDKATQEADYLKWVHAENRRSPEDVAAQTGLMQGTAGIGSWFLQLHAHEQAKESFLQLPDKPKINN